VRARIQLNQVQISASKDAVTIPVVDVLRALEMLRQMAAHALVESTTTLYIQFRATGSRMRLRTSHLRYVWLITLWREAMLAQKVLRSARHLHFAIRLMEATDESLRAYK
jgi:hypothetical protein